MLRPWRRRLRNEHGGTLVETAFTLTLLFAFIIGIAEVSLALYSYHFVSDAAREGTRYAMVRGSDWPTTCTSYASSGCAATAAQVAQYVSSLNFPGIFVSTSANTGQTDDVFVCYSATVPSSAPAACTTVPSASATGSAGSLVQVTITYPFTFGIPGFKRFSYSLSSSSQMVIAQ